MFNTFLIIPLSLLLISILLIFVLLARKNKPKEPGERKKSRPKDRNAIIKEANKKLAQNPKDADALQALADLYYTEQSFDKAYKIYELLLDLCATNPNLDEFTITFRHGMCSLRLKKLNDAYKNLMLARTMKEGVFEIEYNLGYLEFMKKNYEKASAYLLKAREAKPDHALTQKYLGQSLYHQHRYKEAVTALRKSMDLDPEQKDSLFTVGECYYNLGQTDQAVKIFSHLRGDPVMGPSASLYSGSIYMKNRQYEKAIMDFEIGLKHQNIRQEIMLELKYRAAAAYIKSQDLNTALKYLNSIGSINPDYKDVRALRNQYGELNKNKNLQIYLMGSTPDFINLCRRLTVLFFPKAKLKIMDIHVNKDEYADILTEVSTPKWEDLIVFRFVRTKGQVGELVVRDLYSKIKDLKAGRGFCIAAGTFTEGAVQFVEARLIDLIDKEELTPKLNTVEQSASRNV